MMVLGTLEECLNRLENTYTNVLYKVNLHVLLPQPIYMQTATEFFDSRIRSYPGPVGDYIGTLEHIKSYLKDYLQHRARIEFQSIGHTGTFASLAVFSIAGAYPIVTALSLTDAVPVAAIDHPHNQMTTEHISHDETLPVAFFGTHYALSNEEIYEQLANLKEL